jgi:hypothetical protein
MSTYSVYNLQVDTVYNNIVSTASISGAYSQSLTASNTFVYTLTGNATFSYTNALPSVYNFIFKCGTYTLTLDSTANWQTVSATALGYTGSFIMSGIYDGTDMWISAVKNYASY